MSVQELILRDSPIEFRFKKPDNVEGVKIECYFGYDVPRAVAILDHNQAHLLMLYLQEHLK